MMDLRPFHLAIPVKDLKESVDFYEKVLGCKRGRKDKQWVDYNLFGHQLVLHEDKNLIKKEHFNEVDGKSVPVPHFGVVLEWSEFKSFSNKLIKQKIDFQIAPYLRFEGEPGEQLTMFFYDPSGNALEFKSFKNSEQLFEV
ncbi:MAG: glyoxalase [Flavobacteriaceae bacterium]|nr:glyoxalase [Flavobacteriaceae bacterium]